jgi:glycosyltransferase involved in cell wall biosynthesis
MRMTAHAKASHQTDALQAVRRPRVLMVTGAYHPEISSSALQCRNMARALDGRADIHVLTTAVDPSLAPEGVVDGVEVSRVLVDVERTASRIRAAARMLGVLWRLMPRTDVVHLHGFSTKNVLVTAAAKVLGRPVVLSLHTAGFDEAEAIKRHGRLSWWAFTHADLYLSVSPGLVDSYLAAGLPPDRIELAPNGIDTTRFRPASAEERRELRTRLGLPLDEPIVLFVGFFSQDKQPRVLFEAWLRLRHTNDLTPTLLFVGATRSPYFEVDDDLVDRMRRDAASQGVANQVIFAGETHDVQDYFRAADVFALPSRREGLPVALLEAMACGLPCVASRLPGSTDTIVDDGRSGILVPPGDVQALADAIGSLFRNRQLGRTLGAAARDRVLRQFTSADTANRWMSAYDRLQAGRVS